MMGPSRRAALAGAISSLLIGKANASGISAFGGSAGAQISIPPAYFGQLMKSAAHEDGWPSPAFYGAGRLWLQGTDWASTETARGVYDWTALDAAVANAQSAGLDLLYALGQVPGWANGNAGSGVPPSDFQDIYDFVTAVLARYPRIKYLEPWNEINQVSFWSGTFAQMATICQNLQPIAHAAGVSITTPSVTGAVSPADLASYLATGGGQFADIVAVHAYYAATPEGCVAQFPLDRASMLKYGQQQKPLWVTEFGWGSNTTYPNTTLQAQFVAKSFLLFWAFNVVRQYWYDDGGNYGLLVDPATNLLTQAGVAYNCVEAWINGAQLQTYKVTGTIYALALKRQSSPSYSALAIWDSSGGPTTYTPAAQFTQFRDIAGNITPISGNVSLTAAPILLETGSVF